MKAKPMNIYPNPILFFCREFHPLLVVFSGTMPFLLFRPPIKVFVHLLGKVPTSRARSSCRASQSAKAYFGVFFFIAFSFAPVYAKEKANGDLIFLLAVGCTWVLVCRGRRLDDP